MDQVGRDPIVTSIEDEYRARAADYDRRWAAYIEATVARTLRTLSPPPGAHLLDIGCGTGVLLQALAQQHPQVKLSGIDPVAEMLAVARDRLLESVTLHRGRAEQLPFADHAFDLVVSSSTFHYVEQPASALAEMHRVLRPGGSVIITDWCRDYLSMRLLGLYLRLFRQPFHKIYGAGDIREMLEQAGFSNTRVNRYKIGRLWGMMTAEASRNANTRKKETHAHNPFLHQPAVDRNGSAGYSA